MSKKRPSDFEFELSMEMDREKRNSPKYGGVNRNDYERDLSTNAVGKLFDSSGIEKSGSSYSGFIDKYNLDDGIVPEESFDNKRDRKRIRSEAEQEFLDDFSSRTSDFDYGDLSAGHSFFKVFVSSLLGLDDSTNS